MISQYRFILDLTPVTPGAAPTSLKILIQKNSEATQGKCAKHALIRKFEASRPESHPLIVRAGTNKDQIADALRAKGDWLTPAEIEESAAHIFEALSDTVEDTSEAPV